MAIPTDDPRLDPLRIDREEQEIAGYERNPRGEIKFGGNEAPDERLFIDPKAPDYDREELRKVIDTSITQLSSEDTEEIETQTIS